MTAPTCCFGTITVRRWKRGCRRLVQCWLFLYCAGQSQADFAISRELSAVFLTHLSGRYARRSDEGWASHLPLVVHGGGFLSCVSWKFVVEAILENCFQIFEWSQQQLAVFGAGLGESRMVGGVLPLLHLRPPFWASALRPPHGAPPVPCLLSSRGCGQRAAPPSDHRGPSARTWVQVEGVSSFHTVEA